MLYDHTWVKDLLKVQDRLMDFNVTEYNKIIQCPIGIKNFVVYKISNKMWMVHIAFLL